MSNKYLPDKWAIVEVTNKETGETTKRVLASWYGGWAGSDSWKLSSAINEIEDHGHCWEFFNESGSRYICHKEQYGTSGYTAAIYNRLVNESELPDSVVFLKYLQEEEFRG